MKIDHATQTQQSGTVRLVRNQPALLRLSSVLTSSCMVIVMNEMTSRLDWRSCISVQGLELWYIRADPCGLDSDEDTYMVSPGVVD